MWFGSPWYKQPTITKSGGGVPTCTYHEEVEDQLMVGVSWRVVDSHLDHGLVWASSLKEGEEHSLTQTAWREREKRTC